MALCGKSDCYPNLVTGWATLTRNNSNQVFGITANVTFTALWGNFGHSSLQNCCNSTTLEGFWAGTAFLNLCHSISITFRSRLCLGHSKAIQSWTCWCVLDHCSASEPKCASARSHEQMAGHSPSGCFGRRQNSWFHLAQQVFQTQRHQNSPPPYFTVGMMYLFWNAAQNIFLALLGMIKMFLADVRWVFLLFLVSSSFLLELSHGCHFCPVCFLLLKLWP